MCCKFVTALRFGRIISPKATVSSEKPSMCRTFVNALFPSPAKGTTPLSVAGKLGMGMDTRTPPLSVVGTWMCMPSLGKLVKGEH